MALIYSVAALLWLLLAALMFALVTVVFFPGAESTGFDRFVSAAFILLFAALLARQMTTLHARIREMRGNSIELDETGVWVQLGGPYRARKGLPEVTKLRLPWKDITLVTSERRQFVYPSLIPFAYPLDVYTIVAAGAAIAFTSECIPGARLAAREIAGRIGRDVAATQFKHGAAGNP